MKSIIQHFGKYLPLNEKESEALTSRLIEKKNKTQTVYSAWEGDTCKYFTYVVEGCFKMYGVDHSERNTI